MNNYEEILAFIIDKYREVFTSLYSINDDVLDENLLFHLWYFNFVVMMLDDDQVDIWLGHSNAFKGVDRYGFVRRGIARVPDMRFSTQMRNFNEKNSVVIYGNRSKKSIEQLLFEPLSEIASIMHTEQGNLRLSAVKAVLEATASTGDTMLNVFKEMFGGTKNYIVVKRKASLGVDITKTDLDVDYIAKEYQASMLFYHNQILEMLGVNFTPHEKQERLITNEVDSNNQVTQNISDNFIKRIQRYLDKLSEEFSITPALVITKNEQVGEVQEKEKITEEVKKEEVTE